MKKPLNILSLTMMTILVIAAAFVYANGSSSASSDIVFALIQTP